MDIGYEFKKSLPNKLVQEDGTITDITGKPVENASDAYDSKPALPNKFLNPDGTYSTLNEIIASMIDTDIFIIVDELPAQGNPQKIYIVPNDDGTFTEYHWTGTKWDNIGMIDFDLTQYYTKDEVEAKITAALAEAKAYTDQQISTISVDPQVFYWDGTVGGDEGKAFWQKIVNASEKNDIIVYGQPTANVDNNVAYIKKNYFDNTFYKNVLFVPDQLYKLNISVGYTHVRENCKSIKITFVSVSDHTVYSVKSEDVNHDYKFLDVATNYSATYTPQYDGSPATKKYVDDAISTNITTVLSASY